jgi:hypothetical protein
MGLSLVELLGAVGAELSTQNAPQIPSGSLHWIGRLENSPRALAKHGIFSGCDIWSSGEGWVPLGVTEIERWLVDANQGDHLIVCQRSSIDFNTDHFSSETSLIIWTPNKYSQIIGDAVLSNELSISSPTSSADSIISTNIERTHPTSPTHDSLFTSLEFGDSTISIPPVVDVHALMKERGRSGLSLNPVLLEANLWLVRGSLESAGNSAQMEWIIVEDSFSNTCVVTEKVTPMQTIPNISSLPAISQLSELELLHRLPALVEERRAEVLNSGDIDSHVSGGLLRWWRLNPQSVTVIARKIMLPAWQTKLPIEGPTIIHGISGLELPFS